MGSWGVCTRRSRRTAAVIAPPRPSSTNSAVPCSRSASVSRGSGVQSAPTARTSQVKCPAQESSSSSSRVSPGALLPSVISSRWRTDSGRAASRARDLAAQTAYPAGRGPSRCSGIAPAAKAARRFSCWSATAHSASPPGWNRTGSGPAPSTVKEMPSGRARRAAERARRTTARRGSATSTAMITASSIAGSSAGASPAVTSTRRCASIFALRCGRRSPARSTCSRMSGRGGRACPLIRPLAWPPASRLG